MVTVIDQFMDLHGDYVQSFTFDNGSEFISWDLLARIQTYHHKKCYFAHPYSPYERGTNERKNRTIRDYVGYKDYDQFTLDDWLQVADKVNNKPMIQALNGKTPAKVYRSECKSWH